MHVYIMRLLRGAALRNIRRVSKIRRMTKHCSLVRDCAMYTCNIARNMRRYINILNRKYHAGFTHVIPCDIVYLYTWKIQVCHIRSPPRRTCRSCLYWYLQYKTDVFFYVQFFRVTYMHLLK